MATNTPHMRAARPRVPLYGAPPNVSDTNAPMISELLYGEVFCLTEAITPRADFVAGHSVHDKYSGYARASDLMPDEGAGARVSALRSFVFPAPDLKTPPLFALSLGSLVKADFADVDGFVAVQQGGKTIGYIFAAHLTPLAPAPPTNAKAAPTKSTYADVAQQFLGTPYLWGGRSSLGIDCSGLVQISLQQAGRSCPRDSHEQAAALGAPATTPEYGDLLFWKETANITHVGMVSAPNRLLHATAHTMTVIEEDLKNACARIGAPLIKRLI